MRDEITNDSEKTFWTARPPLSSNRVIRVNLHFVRRTCLHAQSYVIPIIPASVCSVVSGDDVGGAAKRFRLLRTNEREMVLCAREIRLVRLPVTTIPTGLFLFLTFPAVQNMRGTENRITAARRPAGSTCPLVGARRRLSLTVAAAK